MKPSRSSLLRALSAVCGVLFVLGASRLAAAAEVIPLWPGGAPGFEDRRTEPEQAESYWVRNIHNPSLTAFLPPKEKATGAAVIVVPGGGHRELVFKAEGVEAAEFLNKQGVAAFVLKHRLGREPNSPYKVEKHAKEDGFRALRLVHSRAAEWGLDTNRIGMMGFSAGGDVVSMVTFGNHAIDLDAPDPIDRILARPAFQILIYPGGIGLPEKVPSDAPPAFLLVANDDRGAARNITTLFQKYRDAGAPVEAHILAGGGHGFNMGHRSKLLSVKGWPQRLADWLVDTGITRLTP